MRLIHRAGLVTPVFNKQLLRSKEWKLSRKVALAYSVAVCFLCVLMPHVAWNWYLTSERSVMKAGDVRSPESMTQVLSGSATQHEIEQFNWSFVWNITEHCQISWHCRELIGNSLEFVISRSRFSTEVIMKQTKLFPFSNSFVAT